MRTRLTRTMLCAPALLIFIVAAADHAVAQFVPDPNVFYQIVEKNSQKCLDVSGASDDIRAPLILWPCHGGPNQKWRFRLIENEHYQLAVLHSGKSLDVRGGAPFTNNGVPIQQYPFNYGWNQEWRLVAVDDGYYHIIARHSERLLTITNGTAQQWGEDARYHQKWKFIPSSCP